MKLRDFRRHTFQLAIRWCQHPSNKNTRALTANLCRWARTLKSDGELEDYGYSGDPIPHVRYCVDRMNQGRAKAILRLLKESPHAD